MNSKDIFVIIKWPDVKALFEESGFYANAELINSVVLQKEYGSSAYLVRTSWLNKIKSNQNETT